MPSGKRRLPAWLGCLLFLMLALQLTLAGCATSRGALPQAPPDGPVWPAAGETPRIRYLGSISHPEDLQIRQSLLSRIWEYVTGGPERGLRNPQAVAVDHDEILYAVDAGFRNVKVFDRNAPRFAILPDDDHLLQGPVAVAVDRQAQRLYVSDSAAGLVRYFPLVGGGAPGELGKGLLERPTGLVLHPATDELLVLDAKQSALFRFSRRDLSFKGRLGGRGTGAGQFNHPTDLTVNSRGEIVVSDSLNFRVQLFSQQGEFLRAFGKPGDTPGYFNRPKGVAVDSDDHIYVVDGLFDNVQVFDREGRLLIAFGSAGQGAGQFWMPAGIAIDRADRIYVADTYNRRIQIFQYLKQAGTK